MERDKYRTIVKSKETHSKTENKKFLDESGVGRCVNKVRDLKKNNPPVTK